MTTTTTQETTMDLPSFDLTTPATPAKAAQATAAPVSALDARRLAEVDGTVECPRCKGQGGTETVHVIAGGLITDSPEDLVTRETYHPCPLCQGYGHLTQADLAAHDAHIQAVSDHG